MDVKVINPFAESFLTVMPQLGFSSVKMGNATVKKEAMSDGVVVVLGIVGDMKGNVAYTLSLENAKQIASTMMMGMPVEELDDMAKSALSELTNMLTANAATAFSNQGIVIDISTPTMLLGHDISAKMSAEEIVSVELFADDVAVELHIALEN